MRPAGRVSIIVLLALVAVFGVSFAVGRATAPGQRPADAVRLVSGVPVGVLDTRAGALAAADNYVAAGITDSLSRRALAAFADELVAPTARSSLLGSSARLSGPPPGTSATGIVVAHSLRAYTRGEARVETWQVGSYWGRNLVPSQYWALGDLTLRWRGGRWQIASLDERVPGPVPARIADPNGATAAAAWSNALAGMSAPYYGNG